MEIVKIQSGEYVDSTTSLCFLLVSNFLEPRVTFLLTYQLSGMHRYDILLFWGGFRYGFWIFENNSILKSEPSKQTLKRLVHKIEGGIPPALQN